MQAETESRIDELRFYQHFIGKMNAVMYVLNQVPFRVDWISDNACLWRSMEMTAAEILQNSDSVVHRLNDYPDFTESVIHAVKRFQENPDITWAGVYRIKGPDDEPRWMIYSARTLEKDERGIPVKVATVAFPVEDIFNTPQTLRDFQKYLSQKIYELEVAQMTVRQKEYLSLLARGYSRKEIAALLNISIHTVDDHRHALLKKFEKKTTAELVRLASRFGL